MLSLTLRKLPGLLVTAVGAMFLTFVLIHLAPGDPLDSYLGQEGASSEEKAEIRARLGLDRPLAERAALYAKRLVTGDLGSIPGKGPVADVIKRRLVATARLAIAAVLISVVVGVGAGLAAGWHAGSHFDRCLQVVLVSFVSAPVFWFGLVSLWLFAWTLNLLPAAGSQGLAHLVLPAVTLGLRPSALIARVARTNVIEVKSRTFVLAAKSRGVSSSSLLFKHVLKVVSIPIVTIVGMDFASLLSGAVITETVFSYQGLGAFAVEAITNRWYDAVMAVVLIWSAAFLVANFLVDLSYAVLDPRIRKAAA